MIMASLLRTVRLVVAAAGLTLVLFGFCNAQSTRPKSPKGQTAPKVTQIGIEALKPLLKPNAKPLLVNFWATWCDPCREEFPDLVKIENEFRGKVDFVLVSLDDL